MTCVRFRVVLTGTLIACQTFFPLLINHSLLQASVTTVWSELNTNPLGLSSGINTLLFISLTMIITYFESKVNLFNSYPQYIHNGGVEVTMICEQYAQRLPIIVNDGYGFCQKKWLLHYRKNGNLPYCEPRTLPTVCYEVASGGSSPDLQSYRSWMRSILERTWCFRTV